MSQGDIERRTGLLRCYLSRVANGHTVRSLETLAKIGEAMEINLADFFPGGDSAQDLQTRKIAQRTVEGRNHLPHRDQEMLHHAFG